MSEAKHTPGPWQTGRKGNECRIYADPDQHAIAKTYGIGLNGIGVCELTGPMNQADARLIAAAPELLEALKLWLDIHDKPAGFIGKFGKSLTEAIAAQEVKVNAAAAAARAAIAKAEGGAA